MFLKNHWKRFFTGSSSDSLASWLFGLSRNRLRYIVAEKAVDAGGEKGLDFGFQVADAARVNARFLRQWQKVIFAAERP